MGFLGKIIKGTGYIIGTTVEYGIKATGEVIGIVADAKDNYELAEKSRKLTNSIGEFLGDTTKVVAAGTGTVVDKTIELGAKAGGEIGASIAKSQGLDEDKSRKIGTMIGGGVMGFAAGDLLGAAISGITAATGVASTGTAISTLQGAAATKATLAHIGGGALSAGGGGVAAGQAVLHSIEAATTVAGSVDGMTSNKKENNNLIEDKSKYVDSIYKVID